MLTFLLIKVSAAASLRYRSSRKIVMPSAGLPEAVRPKPRDGGTFRALVPVPDLPHRYFRDRRATPAGVHLEFRGSLQDEAGFSFEPEVPSDVIVSG
jgi:hypothetical protein